MGRRRKIGVRINDDVSPLKDFKVQAEGFKVERDKSKLLKVIINLILKLIPFLKKKIKNKWVWLIILIGAGVGMFFGLVPDETFNSILNYFIELLNDKTLALC